MNKLEIISLLAVILLSLLLIVEMKNSWGIQKIADVSDKIEFKVQN